MATVGIPRALHYYRYYPLARAFFEALDVELVLSPPTTRAILSEGLHSLVAETCLPVKAYCGHVAALRDKADYVLVPSVRSTDPKLYNCVKIFTLPDIVRGALRNPPPLLEVLFDINESPEAIYWQIFGLGAKLGASRRRVELACQESLRAHRQYVETLRRGQPLPEVLEVARGDSPWRGEETPHPPVTEGPDNSTLSIALLGHPYNIFDEYVNHCIVKRLSELGVRVVTADAVAPHLLTQGVAAVVGSPYWNFEQEITGAAGHYLHSSEVDGVIVITSFGCGPDSMMVDAIQRHAKRNGANPLLSLVIDEHTAETGLVTRLEAFVDMLRRRWMGEHTSAAIVPPAVVPAARTKVPRKVACPHMGTVHVPLQVLFHRIGVDLVVPPPSSKRSLALASHLSPEFACIPYKLTLGNFIEALEMGADTLILLSGPNNCRFGYYHKLQDQVLRELGYDFVFALPEISGRTIKGVISVLQGLAGGRASWWRCFTSILLALSVMHEVDVLERRVQYLRPRELAPGTADGIWREALVAMGAVTDKRELTATKKKFHALLDAVPIDPTRAPVKICIVGEIYVTQEPYINHDVERELGRIGAETHRSEQVSQWLVPGPKLLLEALGLGHTASIKRAEKPYLVYYSGETIGQTVLAHREGYDGVIQLAPFTCTPEITAQNILPRLRQDVDIPVLTLILDEQTGHAGLVTRLEAFVDFLERRRRAAPLVAR